MACAQRFGLSNKGDSDDGVSFETLRSLYLEGKLHRVGENSSVIYSTPKKEFPSVRRLNPLNKRRILVTGVSVNNLYCIFISNRIYSRAPGL